MKIQLNGLQRHLIQVLIEHELGESGMWIEMYGSYLAGYEQMSAEEKNEAIRAALYDLQSQLEYGE
jgi:hypothetical protein